ncbi:Protein-glutamate methylesterase/protein-glutamine glutaminase [Streptomyces antimycoticus]
MMPTSPHGRTELLRPDGSPVRVLVVDDESALADLLSMALRYEGWEVRTAGDGGEAIRITRELRPDAVVLDVMLPDMDGLTVLGRLRRELPDVPVLFLTARDAVEDRIAGLTAGGDDYVAKRSGVSAGMSPEPVAPVGTVRAAARHTPRRTPRRTDRRTDRRTRPPAPAPGPSARPAALVRLAGDRGRRSGHADCCRMSNGSHAATPRAPAARAVRGSAWPSCTRSWPRTTGR